jgi:hypothetical protein
MGGAIGAYGWPPQALWVAMVQQTTAPLLIRPYTLPPVSTNPVRPLTGGDPPRAASGQYPQLAAAAMSRQATPTDAVVTAG